MEESQIALADAWSREETCKLVFGGALAVNTALAGDFAPLSTRVPPEEALPALAMSVVTEGQTSWPGNKSYILAFWPMLPSRDGSSENDSCLQPDVQLLPSPTSQISTSHCLHPVGSLIPALHGGAGISKGSNSQLYHDKSLAAV